MYRRDGALRAPWRWAGFIAVTVVVALLLSRLVALALPPGTRTAVREYLGFWVLLVAVWLAHVVMLRWVDHLPWSFVGLAPSQATPGRLGAGLALGALAILAPSGVLLAVHWLSAEPVAGTRITSWWVFAAATAAFFLPQSLAEEMMIRGYLFASARDSIGWPGALALTSIIFGLLHLGNRGASVEPILLVMLAGVFLGTILLVTDSLYAAWMAHFAWNWAMAAVLHTAVSGVPVSSPDYRVIDHGPDWATGGAWGPEGGIGAAVGMLVGLWILIAWRRRRAARTHHLQPSGTWLNASR